MSDHYFTNHKCCSRHVAPEYYSKPLTQEAAVDVLRGLFLRWHELAHDAGVEYWLIAGSLLGARRNGSIIPYDDDIDVAVNVNQMSRLVELEGTSSVTDANEDWIPVYETADDVLRISPHWRRLVHEEDPKYWIDGKLIDKTYGLWVDIFAYHEMPDGTYSRKCPLRQKLPQFPKDSLFPLREIQFEGLDAKAPHRCDEILETRFGPDFAEPDHALRDGQWIRKQPLPPWRKR